MNQSNSAGARKVLGGWGGSVTRQGGRASRGASPGRVCSWNADIRQHPRLHWEASQPQFGPGSFLGSAESSMPKRCKQSVDFGHPSHLPLPTIGSKSGPRKQLVLISSHHCNLLPGAMLCEGHRRPWVHHHFLFCTTDYFALGPAVVKASPGTGCVTPICCL